MSDYYNIAGSEANATDQKAPALYGPKSTPHDRQELLTPEQFAGKLQIGRSTLFSWLAQGILIEGVHYFRVGRVLRFNWDRDVLLQIREVRISEHQRPVRPVGVSGKHPVNWEY